MELGKVKVGLKVKTTKLGDSKGMMVAQEHLDARQPDKEGEVTGYVPGHGGDVWWVKHNDNTTGAYVFSEFQPA